MIYFPGSTWRKKKTCWCRLIQLLKTKRCWNCEEKQLFYIFFLKIWPLFYWDQQFLFPICWIFLRKICLTYQFSISFDWKWKKNWFSHFTAEATFFLFHPFLTVFKMKWGPAEKKLEPIFEFLECLETAWKKENVGVG